MIWKKDIYETLTGCAALCDEYATECSRLSDIENWYRCIFLNLDSADICRQVAMLYVRGSENTRLLAKVCMEICEKCAEETAKFEDERSQQIYAMCHKAIRSCTSILEMAQEVESPMPSKTPTSLFYGIDLRETLYN